MIIKYNMPLSEVYWQLNDLHGLSDGQRQAVGIACSMLEREDARLDHVCPLEDCSHYDPECGGDQRCECCSRNDRDLYDYFSPSDRVDHMVLALSQDRYLEVHACDGGYDYTFYDRAFTAGDGGRLDRPELSLECAAWDILKLHGGTGRFLTKLTGSAFQESVSTVELIQAYIGREGLRYPTVGSRYTVEARFKGASRPFWKTILASDDFGSAYRRAGLLRHAFPMLWWRLRDTAAKEE